MKNVQVKKDNYNANLKQNFLSKENLKLLDQAYKESMLKNKEHQEKHDNWSEENSSATSENIAGPDNEQDINHE